MQCWCTIHYSCCLIKNRQDSFDHVLAIAEDSLEKPHKSKQEITASEHFKMILKWQLNVIETWTIWLFIDNMNMCTYCMVNIQIVISETGSTCSLRLHCQWCIYIMIDSCLLLFSSVMWYNIGCIYLKDFITEACRKYVTTLVGIHKFNF